VIYLSSILLRGADGCPEHVEEERVLQTNQDITAIVLLTPPEAAQLLRVSVSWLAKARMRDDGPPFIRIGRSIRYSRAALIEWMRI
jgi:excisionase family DNA binding protein